MSHHHGSTINRSHSQYDAHLSFRVRSTDLATLARWFVSQGEFFPSKSKLAQMAIDLAVKHVIESGGEHMSSTEEAIELLRRCEVGSFHPSSMGQFSLMRKLQEEGKREPGSTPVEEERAEVPVEKKKFEDLDPEMQQAAIDGGYRPDLGRYETIEERDKKTKESFDVSLEQLRKQGTLVEPENDEKN